MPSEQDDTISKGAAPYYEAAGRMAGLAVRAFGTLGGVDATSKVFSLNDKVGDYARDEMGVMELMGIELNNGVNLGNAVVAAGMSEREKEEKEKQAAKDRQFQSLLDQINQHIADLNAELDGLYKQRDEINEAKVAVDALIELEKLDHVDPTNPEHQRLLRAAGFDDPDQWGTLTMADYAKRRQELEAKGAKVASDIETKERERHEAQQQLATVQHDREVAAGLEAEFKGNDRLDLTTRGINEDALADYKSKHRDFDPRNATEAEWKEIRTTYLTDKSINAQKTYEAKSKEWALAVLKEIEAPKGSAAYEREVDEIVKTLEPNQVDLMLEDPSVTDQGVRDRLLFRKFEVAFDTLGVGAFKGKPEYRDILKSEFLPSLDVDTKAALLRSEKTPPEIRDLLKEEMQASASQQPKSSSSPSAMM